MITIAAGAHFYTILYHTMLASAAVALSLGAHLSEIFASDKDDSTRAERRSLKM